MTVSSTTNRKTFAGDDVTTSFGTSPVVFYDTSDLVVTVVDDTTGAETALVENTDYTVSGGSGSTGTISLAGGTSPHGALLTDTTLVILRTLPLTQSADFVNNDINDAEVLERALDKAAMRDQQLSEENDRALRLPTVETATDDLTVLPFDRASKYLAFNSSKEPIATSGTDGVGAVPVSAFMETVLGNTTAAAARSTLGVPSTTEAVLDTIIDAKGDLLVGTAADTPAVLTVGTNGTIPMARSAATAGLAYVAALTKAIHGFTYANNGSDAANDIDIAAGGAMDATGAYWIAGAALTKQSDAAWAVGNNAGALDTGAVGNNDYYIWAIARSDTGVTDYLFSLSATAPTMPTNYDFKRLIGWFKRSGGTVVAFKTYELTGGGLEFLWASPTLDINLSGTLTTTRRTDAVKVPLDFSVVAILNVFMLDAGTSNTAWVYCPDLTDLAPSTSAAPLNNFAIPNAGDAEGATLHVRTSSTGTIAARAGTATMDTYAVATVGFEWSRR